MIGNWNSNRLSIFYLLHNDVASLLANINKAIQRQNFTEFFTGKYFIFTQLLSAYLL